MTPECEALAARVQELEREYAEARERLLVEFVPQWEREKTDIMGSSLTLAVDRAIRHHIEHHDDQHKARARAALLTQHLHDALQREEKLVELLQEEQP